MMWLVCLLIGHEVKWSVTRPLTLFCPRCGHVHLDTSKVKQ